MGSNSEIQGYNFYSMLHFHRKFSSSVTPVVNISRICKYVGTLQVNFPRKIIFDTLYNNEFLLGVRSRALAIPSECTSI